MAAKGSYSRISQGSRTSFSFDYGPHGPFNSEDLLGAGLVGRGTGKTSRSSYRSLGEMLSGPDGKVHESIDTTDSVGALDNVEFVTIDMWRRTNIGLYLHYAAVGLCDGLMYGTAKSFCYYAWSGNDNNTCSISGSVIQLAWNIKIFIAFACEGYRPFGMRRKPYIVVGWSVALILLFFTAIYIDQMGFYEYIFTAATIEFFMMIADVNADGYTVQLSKLEHPDRRGRILSNGQLCRFFMCMFAGAVQSFLLNGPTTNPPGKGFQWGLSVSEMFWFMLALTAPFLIPGIYYFQERPSLGKAHQHTFCQQLGMIWDVMHNVVVIMVMIFSLFFIVLAGASNRVSVIIQGEIIQMSQLQFGVDNISTYLTLCFGIMIFKTFLLNRNWRITALWTTFIQAALNLLWLIPILSAWRDPWFTIFIDSSEQFVGGITQVMVSMAVIELAPVNLEATCYELLISVSNAFITLNAVTSTQLMAPFRLAEVTAENDDSAVNQRMANYTYMISAINVFGGLTCIWFFPTNKAMCHEWKERGGRRRWIAICALVFTISSLAYALTCAVLELLPSTSCLKFVGGDGCPNGSPI